MLRECPNCEKTVKGRACSTCGWTERAAAPNTANDYDGRCHWDTRGRACRMVGVGREEGGPWRCEWHGLMARDPRSAEQFEEFERFQEAQRLRYCGQFSHARPGALWSATRGEPVELGPPIPCSDPACRYAPREAALGIPG